MSKTAAILLSLALTALSSGAALAQYQDPRYANADGLDAVYDNINAQARASLYPPRPTSTQLPAVRDPRGYNQFMNQVQGDLNYEYKNNATLEAARARDARMTQVYEQKRITDLADWEKSQINTSSYGGPYRSPRTGHYYYNQTSPGTSAALNQVDERKRLGINQSQDVMDDHLRNSENAATIRGQTMEDVANNLQSQVLSTPTNQFGLQSVGTNLYVRQYGQPDAKLPPVHNAAARIVPVGAGED